MIKVREAIQTLNPTAQVIEGAWRIISAMRRGERDDDALVAVADADDFVITSYSIHYTKLYDSDWAIVALRLLSLISSLLWRFIQIHLS